MAESNPKRQRQEQSFQQEQDSNSKRQKPFLVHNMINNLLDQQDDTQDPTQQEDLSESDIYTTLQKEISLDEFDFLSEPLTTTGSDEGVESVMRHLLEASDDELGIPNTDLVNSSDEDVGVGFMDTGLWEFEDETANYYTFLQSQLFEGFENENGVS